MSDKKTLRGFLLSRQWRDTPNGISLSFWLSSAQGPIHINIDRQQAVCFIRRDNNINVNGLIQNSKPKDIERKPLELQTLDHEPIDALYFKQQRHLNTLRDQLSFDKTHLLESEIKPTERYLMERFITASLNVTGNPIQRNGYLEFLNPIIKPENYHPNLNCVSLDIETEDFRGYLYSIAVVMNDIEHVFIVKQSPTDKSLASNITWCENEKQALEFFFHWIKTHDPDVIIGWNVIAFDLEFIQWKCNQLGIPFNLARGESGNEGAHQKSTILIPQQTGQMHIARIPGRVVLDGISSLRSAFWSFESFALDFVAEQLLNKKKRNSSSIS